MKMYYCLVCALAALLTFGAFADSKIVCETAAERGAIAANPEGSKVNSEIQRLQVEGKKVKITHMDLKTVAASSSMTGGTYSRATICVALETD